MDRILIILKKENGPRVSSAPALGLNTIIFKYVYWLMKQISGERLQDHWSSGLVFPIVSLWDISVAMETTILIQSAPKPNAINPPTQLWFTLNLIKIGLLASEIFFFEIVDRRRTDDDRRRMPAYPISSPVR